MLAKRHWFIAFIVLLTLWVGINLLTEDHYDASLRPLFWLLEQMGLSVR